MRCGKLLNAVAHKDYSSGVPIQISVYPDRVLFWNNGQLQATFRRKLPKKLPKKEFSLFCVRSLL